MFCVPITHVLFSKECVCNSINELHFLQCMWFPALVRVQAFQNQMDGARCLSVWKTSSNPKRGREDFPYIYVCVCLYLFYLGNLMAVLVSHCYGNLELCCRARMVNSWYLEVLQDVYCSLELYFLKVSNIGIFCWELFKVTLTVFFWHLRFDTRAVFNYF